MVKVSEEIDKLDGLIPIQDIIPVKIAVEHQLSNKNQTRIDIFDKYYPEEISAPSSTKSTRITQKVKYVKSKYPEIFKPFRDPDIINVPLMVKDLVQMALDPNNKPADRIKAHKVILSTAVQAEKFSKDKEIAEKTLETVAFEEKTFEDIINETRNKHVLSV